MLTCNSSEKAVLIDSVHARLDFADIVCYRAAKFHANYSPGHIMYEMRNIFHALA
jgi:hypothetical protein